MKRIIIQAGIYKLSTPMRGDLTGTVFPEGSKAYLEGEQDNPVTYIEGSVNGKVRSDILKDRVGFISMFISPVPTQIDLTDEANRRKLLIFLERTEML